MVVFFVECFGWGGLLGEWFGLGDDSFVGSIELVDGWFSSSFELDDGSFSSSFE